MKKQSNLLVIACLLGSGMMFVLGCGQGNNPSPTPSTNYTLSGKVSSVVTLSVSGVKSQATLAVTHIVAIGADNGKYQADYDTSTGTFSVKIVKGMPYALGFYNQSSGAITLLGYFKQNDVNWHSLPLMTVTGEATNLGTFEINTTSVEAIPSISLTDLLTQTGMDQATANLYGQVDELMTMFTNVDVDGNGVFDFDESKAFMLQITVGNNLSSTQGLVSGEIGKMLNQYSQNYYPVPNAYQIILHAKDAPNPANGTLGTVKFPVPIYGANGIAKSSLVGEVWGASTYGWSFMADGSTEALEQTELTTPEVVPSGSYTFEVTGKGTYTFNNVAGVPIIAIGTTESVIFPIFKMVTNEAGNVTQIDYKWMIRGHDGVTREATAAEVKAVIVDVAMNSDNLIAASPTISVFLGTYEANATPTSYRPPLKIDRDAGSIDVSTWSGYGAVKFTDIGMFSCSYKINCNIEIQFMFLR